MPTPRHVLIKLLHDAREQVRIAETDLRVYGSILHKLQKKVLDLRLALAKLPKQGSELPQETMDAIRQIRRDHPHMLQRDIAAELNRRGLKTTKGQEFSQQAVHKALTSRKDTEGVR